MRILNHKTKTMLKPESQKLSQNFLISHYITLALLILLLDKTTLNQAVKTHCKTGLKAIEIIYANKIYKSGIDALLGKEFDAFFKVFPSSYFDNRGLISAGMVIKNIKLCITTDDIVHMISE
ncbi:hypothetical protein Q4Q34_05850 [Flavivirga abyssicola]|uniref:hypothetical protein n=1 Tax=Flavivirga abyssicola TaxID=3063533 RepID=UPI0026DF3747|nr:hypothetical protein [Flavivirga sp. MEBiC07777]WVK14552.1 hypothetical protein Q4Q34_05850 [Flavivirga sp. MEBiC07777]